MYKKLLLLNLGNFWFYIQTHTIISELFFVSFYLSYYMNIWNIFRMIFLNISVKWAAFSLYFYLFLIIGKFTLISIVCMKLLKFFFGMKITIDLLKYTNKYNRFWMFSLCIGHKAINGYIWILKKNEWGQRKMRALKLH